MAPNTASGGTDEPDNVIPSAADVKQGESDYAKQVAKDHPCVDHPYGDGCYNGSGESTLVKLGAGKEYGK